MSTKPDERAPAASDADAGRSTRPSQFDLTKASTGPVWRQYLRAMGPGLVTGASDDDPSGIATYSQAGAGNEHNPRSVAGPDNPCRQLRTVACLNQMPIHPCVVDVAAHKRHHTGPGA